MSNKAILLFVFFVGTSLLNAQRNIDWKKENFPGKEAEFKKAYKIFMDGEKQYYQGPPHYEDALDLFLEAYKFNPDNAYLNFQMGHIYFALHRAKYAEKYYERALQLDPASRKYILYELAVSYHQDAEWDEAVKHYEEYRDFIKQGGHHHYNIHEKDVPHELQWIDLCIRQCVNGKIITHDTLPIIFENISPAINTEYPEYSAVVNHLEDLLIFVSRRPSSTGDKKHHGMVFEYDDVFYSRRTENGWSSAQHIHGDVNSHAHEAPVWVSGDGTHLLLYYNKARRRAYKKQGDIYESFYTNGAWTLPTPMKMVNSPWRETHASISNDGKTIYFTTNNPKYAKHGGMDIVKITYDDATQQWSKPVDVGGTINTIWDEESPFIKPDNKHFYFSSQGHSSIGGFDFFSCELKDTGFSEPTNLGYPLNTPYDDPFIYVSDDGRRVFFNSTRIGGFGSNDIYEGFILKDIDIPVEILVKDSITHENIEDAIINVSESGDKPHYKEVIAENNETYYVYVGVNRTFEIDASANGYLPKSATFNTVFNKIVHFDTLKIQLVMYLAKPDTGTHHLLAFSGQLFDEETKQPIEGAVGIYRGNEEIALVKTKNSRFTAFLKDNTTYTLVANSKGYYQENQVFTYNSQNLRKELYLGKGEGGDVVFVHDTVYVYKNNNNNNNAKVVYIHDTVYVYKNNNNTKVDTVYIYKDNNNNNNNYTNEKSIVVNIYYDTDKYNIKPEYIGELERVLDYLKANPEVTVGVSSHTDSKGDRARNMTLSTNRSNSVVNWLISKGISKNRIVDEGFGPDKPIATNGNAEGRSLNRRTEVRIIKK